MNKFKKATKRIAAIGVSALMVSSAAFAGGLGSYPNNFVKDGKFEGTVVYGANADSSDSTMASAVIAELGRTFSGEKEQVKITYKKTSGGSGDEFDAVKDGETFNFGEKLTNVSEELDDNDIDLLDDEDLKGDDYTQTLKLTNGELDYKIFDDVDGEDKAKAGLYYASAQTFAQYTVEFTDLPDISGTNADDYVGETMTIMGNEFTVIEIGDTLLEMVGGANKISLDEGQEVTVDGVTVGVTRVSDDKAYVTVGSDAGSVDLYDTATIGGISIALTDVFEGTDRMAGTAQLVVGGQKIKLDGTSVEVNEEDVNDVYEDYDVTVAFTAGAADKFEGFVLSYKVDDNTLLEKGDSLKDVLFDTFNLKFNGMNDVDYSSFKIDTSKTGIDFSGKLHNGVELPSEFEATTDDTATANLYLGSKTKKIWFKGSDVTIDLINSGYEDAITFTGTDTVNMDLSQATTDVKDNMFFSYKDEDDFYLYKIKAIDKDELEVDFEELFENGEENSVDIADIDDKLEGTSSAFSVTATNTSVLDTDELGKAELYLANELMMEFTNIETENFNSSSTTSIVSFSYNSEIDPDNAEYENLAFNVSFKRAADEDADPIKMTITKTGGAWATADEELEEDSDTHIFVDGYGTILKFDDEDSDNLEIMVPEEEVQADVKLVFGEAGDTETGSVIVDKDDVESKKAALEKEGYTITGTEDVQQERVEFGVKAAILDTDVSGTDDLIVVGGPAVNAKARALMGISTYTLDQAGVSKGNAIIRYFENSNSVLVYGYDAQDTVRAVEELNAGGLSGATVNVN